MRAKASRKPAETDFKLDCYPHLALARQKPPTAKFSRVSGLFFVRSRDSLFFVPSPTVDWHRRAGRVKDAVLPHLA